MRRSVQVEVVAVGLALLLTGCSKTGDETASGGDASSARVATKVIDPCSLISADEMTAITTDKVTQVEKTGPDSCKYHSNPDEGVMLTVDTTDGVHQMQVRRNAAKVLGGMGAAMADKSAAGADAADMLKQKSGAPAIGDEAMWQVPSTLAVRKGTVFVEVMPPLMHDPANHTGYPLIADKDKRAIAVAVATKVLAKAAP